MSVHAQRLERWLGADVVSKISDSSLSWYGPPIPIAQVPGHVYAKRGGEFVGKFEGGYYASLADYGAERVKRILRNSVIKSRGKLHMGFTSLSDLISEATTGGKSQFFMFTKAGATGVVGVANTLWTVGPWPVIGAAGGTTGTGAVRTNASVGALAQTNAGAGDTLHLTTLTVQASVAGQLLLLYDRLWDMTHTMTLDPRSVDAANVPTRYQTAALAPGNFISGEVTTVLPAATPTVAFTYTDQGGVSTVGPAFSTIRSAAAVSTVPFTTPSWFYPLDSADTGARALANTAAAVDLSAAMASGVVTWFLGHPLCFIPMPSANIPVIIDGINSAFNLQRVYDGACLSFLELAKSATTATNWWGQITMVSG